MTARDKVSALKPPQLDLELIEHMRTTLLEQLTWLDEQATAIRTQNNEFLTQQSSVVDCLHELSKDQLLVSHDPEATEKDDSSASP